MKFQQQKASCGPAALSAALEAVGIERTEAELATLCKTGADGTDYKSMLLALSIVRQTETAVVGRHFQDTADVALLRLLRALDDGHAVVVCVSCEEPWDHYACVIGTLGKRLICFDPGSAESMSSMTADEFMAWWRGPKGERKPFYGILV